MVNFACDSSNTFQNQTVSTYVVEGTGNPNAITINPGEPFAGLSAQEYRYDLTSVASVPVNAQQLPTAILGMRFKSRLVPMFQFAVFYDKDLEIAPGADMTLSGRVHSNGDLYLNSGATLAIKGQVSTKKASLYRGTKRDNTCTSTVNIYDPTNPTALTCSGASRTTYNSAGVAAWNNQINLGVPQITVPPPESFNPAPGSTYWDKADLRVVLKLDAVGNPAGIEVRDQNNTPNTTAIKNLQQICPSVSVPLKSAATTASTTLSVNSTTGFAVGDKITVGYGSTLDYDNNVITSITPPYTITLSQQLGSNQPMSGYVSKAIVSTSNTFFNNREKRGAAGTSIRMLDVDARGLFNCIQGHKKGLDDDSDPTNVKGLDDATEGGLVWFLTVAGLNYNTINNYGVRVYNGAYLYSNINGAPEIKGLTIVSDQAAYIQGDYNKRDDPFTPVTPAINEADDPATTAVVERKRPAAILADTINVLSDNWNPNDSTSTGGLGGRPALQTQINAAFLAATDTTGGAEGAAGLGGAYNGGLENYPRLHEDWSGQTLSYRGSFVSLGTPLHVNGPWCNTGGPPCNIYNAPVRNWDYDADFNNAANLPPLTPRFVYLRQEVFSRSFDR